MFKYYHLRRPENDACLFVAHSHKLCKKQQLQHIFDISCEMGIFATRSKLFLTLLFIDPFLSTSAVHSVGSRRRAWGNLKLAQILQNYSFSTMYQFWPLYAPTSTDHSGSRLQVFFTITTTPVIHHLMWNKGVYIFYGHKYISYMSRVFCRP